MSQFLLIRHLEVTQANALTSNYAVTAAPIMAISLFAHALGLKTGSVAMGIGIIHHNARYRADDDYSSGFSRPQFQQRRSATYIDKHDHVGTTMALSLQPVATVDLDLSLVIELSQDVDVGHVQAFLDGGRIAGGAIVSYRSVELFKSKCDDLYDAIPGNGYWLIDRPDLMAEGDPITALVRALGSRSDKDSGNGHLCPAVTAYALATAPVERMHGVRSLSDGTHPPHAYGEPLLGLAQYVPVRDIESDQIPLWRSKWIDSTVYSLSTLQEKTNP